MKITKQEREEAIKELREQIKTGETVYTVMRHCSRSGMYRAIDCYIMRKNQPVRISWTVARACGMKYDRRHEAIGVGGCGMDMGYHLVSNLSYCLFPDGFTCTGEKCPSNDHSNGDRNRKPHKHTSGGYALQHRWQ